MMVITRNKLFPFLVTKLGTMNLYVHIAVAACEKNEAFISDHSRWTIMLRSRVPAVDHLHQVQLHPL
jgi:hypothetical protein